MLAPMRAPAELHSCPSCGEARLRALDFVQEKARSGGTTVTLISGCNNCGLIFVNPPPSAADLEARYEPGGHWHEKLEKRKEGSQRRVQARKQEKYEQLVERKLERRRHNFRRKVDKRLAELRAEGQVSAPQLARREQDMLQLIEANLRKTKLGYEQKLAGEQRGRATLGKGGASWRSFMGAARQLYRSHGSRRVLDFGCGDGSMLDQLQDEGWETAGIDPATADAIQRHRMLERLPAEPAYDLIIMKHVLEHLADPLSVLRAARSALVEGGHLIVGVPSLDGLAEHRKKRYCINRFHHLTAYTQRSLGNLLAMAGFEIMVPIERPAPFRMGFVARAVSSARPVGSPLRDACREFHKLAIAEEGWLRATILPVRFRARQALRRGTVGKQRPSADSERDDSLSARHHRKPGGDKLGEGH